MLELMLLRLLAPRAFQLINVLGIAFVLVGIFAIASGMIDHDRNHLTHRYERAEETR